MDPLYVTYHLMVMKNLKIILKDGVTLPSYL